MIGTERPQGFPNLHVEYQHIPFWASHSTFQFCTRHVESERIMACVVCLLFEEIQRRAWVTASTSLVKLEVGTVRAALSSWMVVAPLLTVKPYPDWSLVTEPSVYTVLSCGLLFTCMISLISDSVLPTGHPRQTFPSFLTWVSHRDGGIGLGSFPIL